jgi:hypothetical protein
MHSEQKRILRAMTPQQKLRVALRLYHSVRQLKAAGLRAQHPEWTEADIREKLRDIMLHART